MVKKHRNSNKVTLKAPQKILHICLFLKTPKWIFISGPDQLAHADIIGKRPKKSV
jgi:hypothetical protein